LSEILNSNGDTIKSPKIGRVVVKKLYPSKKSLVNSSSPQIKISNVVNGYFVTNDGERGDKFVLIGSESAGGGPFFLFVLNPQPVSVDCGCGCLETQGGL